VNHRHEHGGGGGDATARRAKWVWIGFAVVAAVFLWTEHRAHLLGWLPFLLLAACPLLHLFMHGGHGHGGRGGEGHGGGAPGGKDDQGEAK
jgi:hypothetical protein